MLSHYIYYNFLKCYPMLSGVYYINLPLERQLNSHEGVFVQSWIYLSSINVKQTFVHKFDTTSVSSLYNYSVRIKLLILSL